MKGFFSWAAVALLVASTSINYSMVSTSSTASKSGNSSVVRTPSSGGWHK
ncbi:MULTISPECIES: hypothetical protein [Vitreoscilla]|uniref:Uncharacterized protein n=1 Tax=Vitreoscilla stercoraria TaxID=61 RepID=A0ABY4EA49_VITST|nr:MULTISPECIES: hypothetical protein [Vitreoscilla]AUZ03886.1 hypothetical protein ADP71_00260 [Vitreoscilla sp. C1]UOO92188.1 hypothetical protein LVJ81_11285 [Vitreoscilla stercoraria]